MKATIFKNGHMITLEGTPEEISECINNLESKEWVTYPTGTPDLYPQEWYTGTPFKIVDTGNTKYETT